MNKRRVVITGLGALAPNGNSVPEYWDALISGTSGIDHITYFDTENLSVKIAGELSNFNPEDYFDKKEIRKLDPFTIYHLISSAEAISNSGINEDNLDLNRVGVMIGSGVGGIQTLEEQHGTYKSRGQRRVSPFFVPRMIANIAA